MLQKDFQQQYCTFAQCKTRPLSLKFIVSEMRQGGDVAVSERYERKRYQIPGAIIIPGDRLILLH